MFTFFPEVLFEDYPEGMYDVAMLGASYGVPVMIAENGKAEPDETTGELWLRPHLEALLRAYTEGADVEGYFYWSLVDNYEWNHGTSMHFGLHSYDMTTKARSARPLATDYTALIGELTQ
jgi:beta-glucosidase